MVKKYSTHLTWLLAIIALAILTTLFFSPSWSSPASLFVTTSAPANLPLTAGTDVTLSGGGFSQATSLWLVPERSIRSVITATLETYGNPLYFIRRDDHLYIANGVGGFFIVQGLQSTNPSISGALNSGGQGMEIVLHRDEAIMAAGNSGLQVIDIRDHGNPQLLATLKSLSPALSVAGKGKIVYVATAKSGVQIVDLSDPRNPQRLGKMADLPEAYKVICTGELLIVVTGTGGLVYDISQPEKPRRLAQLPVTGGLNTVMTQSRETLYWATKTLQGNRLYSLDLSRPEAPRVLTSVPLSNTPMGISCSDEQIAIALGSSGTEIFSPEGEFRLTPLHTIVAKSRTRFALPLGSDLWVGDGSGELLRIGTEGAAAFNSPPILPDFSSRIPPIVTSQLVILGDEDGLAIHARWVDTAPILLARLAIPGLVQQYLSADQKRLWLAIRNVEPLAGGKLISVDISAPHAPRIVAEIPLASPAVIIGEVGTTLVIATRLSSFSNPLLGVSYAESLHFIDISLPEAPSPFLSYPLGNRCSGLTLTGHSLVMMQSDGLFRLIDLTKTHAPKELGSLQTPWLHVASWSSGRANIVVKDKVAFISSPLGEIVVIALHDPHRPEKIGEFKLGGPVFSLLLSDRFLFAEIKQKGLAVIDIKDPLAPNLLGSIPLPGYNHIWTAQGEMLWYVSNESKGIWSLPLPRLLQNATAATGQFIARLEQPLPGPYRFWLTDQQNLIVVPGVTWIGAKDQTR